MSGKVQPRGGEILVVFRVEPGVVVQAVARAREDVK